jgi:hypothetical protein
VEVVAIGFWEGKEGNAMDDEQTVTVDGGVVEVSHLISLSSRCN